MNFEKYNRTVSLLCPTCGETQFEGANELASEVLQCASCGRETTREELMRENSENISLHVNDIGNEVVKDLADEFQKSLKKAFSGSKFIKIR